MSNEWYFSKNNNVDDVFSDEFVDSKFGIDKWTSFTREIIQNSIDAKDDTLGDNIPVQVCFDLNTKLTLNDIPGSNEIKDIINKCIDYTNHSQTIENYKSGLTMLDKGYVYCLKISDYNTIGVESGRDNAWGAFVYDTGKSIKHRPGSAGSYGVGKKVPFIISSINTVFYSTKNSIESLTEGKSVLVDFKDKEGIRRSHIGWYGIKNSSTKDPRNKINPIEVSLDNQLNSYFKRLDKNGTDVIIIGVDAYNKEIDIQNRIINAVLENFFVAIIEGNLEVKLSGFNNGVIEINKNSFYELLDNYYNDPKGIKRETDTLIMGNLTNYCEALDESPEIININDKLGNEIGFIKLYFLENNSKRKKYYSLIRSHGMKICDYHINTEQPFTAVASIQGDKLNEILSKLENAAHDNFVTDDPRCDNYSVEIFKKMKKAIERKIFEKTTIKVGDEQSIDGLEDLISLQGSLQTISKNNIIPKIKKKKISKKLKNKRKKPTPKPDPTPKLDPDPDPKPSRKKKKMITKKKSVELFNIEPIGIYSNGIYHFKFSTKFDLHNSEVSINAIDLEDSKDETIGSLIKWVKVNGNLKKIDKNIIKNLHFERNVLNDIEVCLKIDNLYKLDIELFEIIKELK